MLKKSGNEGITLISLVVTIIVLLILAGISISMLSGENGILQRATDSKERTEKATVIELAQTDILGQIAENKGEELEKTQLKSVLDTYFKNVPSDLPDGEELLNLELTTLNKYGTHQIKVSEIYNGNIQSNSVELKVGDYVKYGEKLTADTYTTDTNKTGYATTQTFQTNTSMLWRVLSIDGNKVELIATQLVSTNDNTEGLILVGQNGFLNSETILKNLCEKLYNSDYGTGRSIKINDINKLTGFNPETSTWLENHQREYYNETYTYSEGGPFWYKDESNNEHFANATVSNPITIKNDVYEYEITESMTLYDTLISGMDESESERTGLPGYWLSSRCCEGDGWGAIFSVRYLDFASGVVSCYQMVNSNKYGHSVEEDANALILPIVTLNSGISITNGSGTLSNPYEL